MLQLELSRNLYKTSANRGYPEIKNEGIREVDTGMTKQLSSNILQSTKPARINSVRIRRCLH
jgi:hypothetical protein